MFGHTSHNMTHLKAILTHNSITQEFGEVKNCVASCNKDGLMKHLENQQKELEICEKALAEYMESKRRAFPRFYFVSSADLLDILSNGNNPIKVMQHMNKCFQVQLCYHSLSDQTRQAAVSIHLEQLLHIRCIDCYIDLAGCVCCVLN